jgi:hypothetical protein
LRCSCMVLICCVWVYSTTMHPWDETNLIMVYYLFDMLLNSVCSILLRIFASMFNKEIGL